MRYEYILAMMSPHAKKAVNVFAQRHAVNLEHAIIDTGHLLLALMSEESSRRGKVGVEKLMFNGLHVTRAQVREAVVAADHMPTKFSAVRPHTKGVDDALAEAVRIAKRDPLSPNNHVTRVHIAQALSQRPDAMFLQVLEKLGIELEQFKVTMEGKYEPVPSQV